MTYGNPYRSGLYFIYFRVFRLPLKWLRILVTWSFFGMEVLLARYFPRPRLQRFMVQPFQWSKLGRWWTLLLASWLLASPWVLLQVPEIVPNPSVKRPCWQVSSFGRCRDTRGKITLGWSTASGYRKIKIQGHDTCVHRLVAYSFLEPPPSEAAWQVNHIDGNCSNNRICNLEWANPSENIRHSYATNPSRGNAGSKRARPVMIRSLGSCNWTRFSSIKLAAQKLGQLYSVQHSSVPMQKESAGGWLWV